MADIEHNQYIKASAAKIYEALTTAEGLGAVWTAKLKVEPQPGYINEFDFNDNYATKMKVTALVPEKKVEWLCVESDPEWIGTTVSFDLTENDKGVTTVVLRHLNWKDVTEFYRWCNYNWAFFLYSLKQYCEEGEGIPFHKRKF